MRRIMFLALTVLFISRSAVATSITIGAPGEGGDSIPFGSNFPTDGGSQYQQVYGSGLFSRPLLIENISFFNNHFPGVVDAANYSIDLSTTDKPVADCP